MNADIITEHCLKCMNTHTVGQSVSMKVTFSNVDYASVLRLQLNISGNDRSACLPDNAFSEELVK